MNEQPGRPQPLQPPPPPHEYAPADEISLIELLNVVLKNRRMVVLTPLTVFVLVVAYAFLQPRTYTAISSFVPQTSAGSRSAAAGLAAQFGIAIPTGDAGQSPQFYADLITSREILRPLTDSTLTFREGNTLRSDTLSGILRIEGDSPAKVRERTIQALSDRISVSTDRETGLITVSVTTWWPHLSNLLAEEIIRLLNRFNLETRQSQANAERSFIEARFGVVGDSLRAAEDVMESFLQKNRQWENSAELQFVHDRLQRTVNSRQQVYTSLNQALEQARIDEVRDTPVITVVQKPEPPALPDRRRLLLKGILALMVGGMLGIFGAFGREFMLRGRQQETDEFAEFEHLKRETLSDLRRPWRLLRR